MSRKAAAVASWTMSSASRPTIIDTKRASASRCGATWASNSSVLIALEQRVEGRALAQLAELVVLAHVLRRLPQLERLLEVPERLVQAASVQPRHPHVIIAKQLAALLLGKLLAVDLLRRRQRRRPPPQVQLQVRRRRQQPAPRPRRAHERRQPLVID